MSENEKKTLKQKRDELVNEARRNIEEAEKLSDELGDGFSWSLAYGMGGYYKAAGDPDYEDSDYENSDSSVGEWVSSSQNC